MLSQLSAQLSEINPQLWREVKSRVNWRSASITATGSGLGQLVIWRFFQQQAEIGNCDRWQLCQLSLFTTLTAIAMLLLLLLGSYFLVKDFIQEGKQGTLTLLRLSPERSSQILLGKLVGVPILLYWAIVLAVPFHLWVGFTGNLPSLLIWGSYLICSITCLAFYNFVLVYAVSWAAKAQAWYISSIAMGVFFIWLIFWATWLAGAFYREAQMPELLFSTILFSLVGLVTASTFWSISLNRFRSSRFHI
jgi:hypothetical protein